MYKKWRNVQWQTTIQVQRKGTDGDLGLNMYEMDVRQYDPALARWIAMDPVTHHSQSPYNAFDGNPVFWADPSGADVKLTGQDARDYFGRLKDHINSKQRKTDAELEYEEDGNNDCCDGFIGFLKSLFRWNQRNEKEHTQTQQDREIMQAVGNKAEEIWEVEKEAASYLPGGSIATALMEGDVENAGSEFAVEAAFTFIPFGKAVKKALPALDATGKVHGTLPKVVDFANYTKDELQILYNDLKQSVQKRIEVTSKMGRDRAHGQRQGAEQDLIKSLEKYLKK